MCEVWLAALQCSICMQGCVKPYQTWVPVQAQHMALTPRVPPGLADHLVDEYLLALSQASGGRRQNGHRLHQAAHDS